MTHTSNDPLRRSPESILREAREARGRAIGDGFRWLWRKVTHGSDTVSPRHVAEGTGAAH
jgi:hypothetical protein